MCKGRELYDRGRYMYYNVKGLKKGQMRESGRKERTEERREQRKGEVR